MNLVIVESPTKEKTISKFLDKKEFIVKSSYGHVRDLPKTSLGVDVEKGFKPTYLVISRAKKIVAGLTQLVSKADNVYLATDFDREGEAIAWHLSQILKIDEKKAKRITFHEITKEAIREAVKKPRKLDLTLVDSQQARRILDRLVGYKLSPLLWRKVASGLSAGRVQSVAVRLIVEREFEIKNFKSSEYYKISAMLSKDNIEFSADLISKNNVKFQEQTVHEFFAEKYTAGSSTIKTKENCDSIIQELQKAQYQVKEITKKKINRNPSAPYTTSTLQQDAVRKLSLSSFRVMSIAQSLYEGIDLPEGTVGLITYMRTDSVNVAKEAQVEATKYITEKIGKEYLPEKPRIYKTKSKGAQEAHEAIRPTSVFRDPETISKYLNPDQMKLYKMIWQRFVASQMSEARYDGVNVQITAGEYLFSAAGRTLIFPGFLKVMNEIEEEDSGEDTPQEKIIPEMEVNEILKLLEVLYSQHQTEPPPRYNEASLIKTLEKHGIGRPSTYAPTISNILNRKYVFIQSRKFYPSEIGISVNDLLKSYFSEIVDINFTASVEEKLDEIADGKMEWEKVVSEFYTPFNAKMDHAESKIEEKQKPILTEIKCPLCSANMYLRTSRFGKFYSCSNFPRCKGKQQYNG
ncbi:MAG: DNA topoisomerase I [Elusimicrobia bacterium RIFOXYA2_FULL_39_19]|nr:MAG: DNA topoisomerase I [Elusimicrobia bacterium RIFOXYA2_FULL_39_19]